MEQQLILDRYRPLAELGEGGFGTVVLAWDTRMQRRVAIKRLALPLDSRGVPHKPPGLAEARTAAMLNHPNIVTVFDFDTDEDEAFLVMEFVDGASLADLLDDLDGPLTIDEASSVFDDVASALEFAHDNGVLHLDIKPENVLVTRDGRAKVADFGLAALSTLAGHGPAWGGTLGYMPLEQLTGGRVTERTDEWALAALAYETLTGENPFAQDTPEAAVETLESLDPPPPSHYEPDLAPEVDDALLTALQPRPVDRHAGVGEFADALITHLGDAVTGQRSLAELVDAYADEAPGGDEDHGLGTIGLWDRLSGPLGLGLLRAVAALEAGWLAWTGLRPFGFEPLAYAAGIALVAFAGALAPSLGVGLGFLCFAAGLAAAGNYLIAVLVGLLGAAWWWLVARRSAGSAVLPLSAPVLGMARLAFSEPLIAGFTLPPARAAVTGLLGGMLTMLASAASQQGVPYLAVWPPYALDVWNAGLAAENVRALVLSPATYVALAGWPLAALIMSVMCSRATRVGAIIGSIGGVACLVGSYLLAHLAAGALGLPDGWNGSELAVSAAASLILMLLVVALGAPPRSEADDRPSG